MQVTVYAGSAKGNSEVYARAAEEFAGELAQAGVGIVYGGGSVGLMGVVADAALREGGRVTGVIPQSLAAAEIAHPSLTSLHVVGSMSERKELLANFGDCYVALPGGLGTLEEIFEVWASLILGHHRKPVMLLNVDGYWDSLLSTVGQVAQAGFMRLDESESLIAITSAGELFEVLATWEPPPPRWKKKVTSSGSPDHQSAIPLKAMTLSTAP